MTVNFNDSLNKKMADVERPPLCPPGTYRAAVKKIPSIETIGDGKWDVLDFQMQLIEVAADDVDQDELKKFGGLGNHAVMRHRFMFSKEDEANFKRTEYNLKRFLQDHLKVDGAATASLKEAINNSVNAQCLVTVKWRADKNDPETMYSEINRTAPLSD